MKIIDLAIAHPYLEDDSVCSQWPTSDLPHADKLRYDNYCCHVFNVLETAWEFCGGDRQRMRRFIGAEELIWRHRRWWQGEPDNQKGYQVGFRNFVAAMIEKCEKETTE